MNILLINVPSRRGKAGFGLPMGLLYVGGIIERCGHKAKILDIYLDDIELKDFDTNSLDKIYKTIEDFKPSIIGYGGIATSYGRTKKISCAVKVNYPDIFQITGGPLSSVYELLLTKTAIDVVFHGETEVNLPIFLARFEQKEPFNDISGISYLQDRKIIKNTPAQQIEDLDTIPLPAYHLVEAERYFHNAEDWYNGQQLVLDSNFHYRDIAKRIGNGKYYFDIVTSRGCTHRCLFCYRHVHGIRQHSVAYVVRHLKYLKETYDIRGFEFNDELFNSRLEWVTAFCDALEDEDLNIFYIVGGARVDKINEKILRRLKDTGCVGISYGHESGSDTILKEYNKGTTCKQNKDITLLTTKIGISCPVQLVIGSPGESLRTIYETIQFLKDLDAYRYSLNYLIALPETPIWEYVKENRLVGNIEMYLDSVSEYGGKPILNLTKMPEKVWKNLHRLVYKEVRLQYYRRTKTKNKLLYIYLFAISYRISPLLYRILSHIPLKIKRKLIPRWIKSRIGEFSF
ncbi:B12-binding domain-containing radical SAM protein [Candidatus Omnitrophota bacterium]